MQYKGIFYKTMSISSSSSMYLSLNSLVGHLPIELSRVLDYYFLKQQEDNFINAQVTGKRKREVGLVIPARYTAHTMEKNCRNITSRIEEKERTF